MAVKAGRYRGQSAQERVAARREQLVAATLEVWARVDGPPVTMTRICHEAGLTERYFYEQFANLDEALLALLAEITDEIRTVVDEAITRTEGGPAERVRAAVAAFVHVITDDPRKGRVAILRGAARPTLSAPRSAMLRGFGAYAASEAAALYGTDALQGRDGELAGLMFIGGVEKLVSAWLEGSIDAEPDDIVDVATRAFDRLGHN